MSWHGSRQCASAALTQVVALLRNRQFGLSRLRGSRRRLAVFFRGGRLWRAKEIDPSRDEQSGREHADDQRRCGVLTNDLRQRHRFRRLGFESRLLRRGFRRRHEFTGFGCRGFRSIERSRSRNDRRFRSDSRFRFCRDRSRSVSVTFSEFPQHRTR